jgi:hypothetical protein
MHMIEVSLPIEQWQQTLAILARAPWSEANPLIMAIGEQLRVGAETAVKRADAAKRGNGVDAEAAPGERPA